LGWTRHDEVEVGFDRISRIVLRGS
jgi:hypothetical protein